MMRTPRGLSGRRTIRAIARRKRRARITLTFEGVENRTLLAAGIAAVVVPPPVVAPFPGTSAVQVITVQASSRALYAAVSALFDDLNAAYGAGGTGTTAATRERLRSDLAQIFTLANVSASAGSARAVSSDVSTIVDAGQVTPSGRQALLSDLQTLVAPAGLTTSLVVSSFNASFAGARPSATTAFPADLTDPNAIGTSQVGSVRGQGQGATSPGATSVGTTSPGAGMPGSGPLGANFRKLLDDLRDALAGSQFVTPGQKTDLRKDLAAVLATSHRPSDDAVATLRADLAALAPGGLTDEARAQLAKDFAAMLHSAGVPGRIANRTMTDLTPILNAADLDPTALRTVLTDLVNVLTTRPKASNPLGGWWLGGMPR